MTQQPSQAARLTRRQRGAVIGAVARMHWPYECEYGHFDCSNRNRGPCSNECAALNARPEKENDR